MSKECKYRERLHDANVQGFAMSMLTKMWPVYHGRVTWL